MKKILFPLVAVALCLTFITCASKTNFQKELQNQIFITKKTTGSTEYSFSEKQMRMRINYGKKDFLRSLDLVKIDNEKKMFIAYPSKEEIEKFKSKSKSMKVSHRYAVYFWEKPTENQLKLIISKKTAKSLEEAEKTTKPEESMAMVILADKK